MGRKDSMTLVKWYRRGEIVENLRVGKNFELSDHQIFRFYLKLEFKAQINNAMVPDFRKAYCELFARKGG